jgi:hypothetical protein
MSQAIVIARRGCSAKRGLRCRVRHRRRFLDSKTGPPKKVRLGHLAREFEDHGFIVAGYEDAKTIPVPLR